MHKKIILTLAAAATAFFSCDTRPDLIKDNVANAEIQLGSLLKASEEGDTIRIPSSYQDGKIIYVPTDDWVSGFFAGSLWYMYELTGDEFWAEHARSHTEVLDSIQYLTWHHDVGFMVYDSYGNGLRLKNIDGYKDVCVNTAKSLSTRFRPGAGVLQSWNTDRGWQAERGWKCPVIIDNMMNLELLFKATEFTGDSTYAKIAISHADKTLENHFRPDWSCYHVVDYDPETGKVLGRCTAQGYADESAWARGQAWALYGFAVAYRFTGDRKYLDLSEHVAEYLFSHPNMPEDLVPYWDFNAPSIPDEPRDASSAAVIASGLYELSYLTGKASYKETADKSSTPSPHRHTEQPRGPTEASFSCTRWAAFLTEAASTCRSTTRTTTFWRHWYASATSRTACLR